MAGLPASEQELRTILVDELEIIVKRTAEVLKVEPEVLRFGITPMYLGHTDVWDAVETLRRVLDEELWRAPEFQERDAVT